MVQSEILDEVVLWLTIIVVKFITALLQQELNIVRNYLLSDGLVFLLSFIVPATFTIVFLSAIT